MINQGLIYNDNIRGYVAYPQGFFSTLTFEIQNNYPTPFIPYNIGHKPQFIGFNIVIIS